MRNGSDGTVRSYAAIGEGIYDSGSRFYDLDERLLLWTRNVTDSSRHAFLVWEEGRVAMIIDTGGNSYSIGPDDVEMGIQTYIYRFDEPVEFEDLLLY